MLDVVRATAEQVFLPLTVGGGVRAVEDVRALLLAGADKVGINTAAVARSRAGAPRGRRLRQPGHRRRRRRAPSARPPEATLGGLHPRRAQGRTGIDAVAWCVRMAALGAGEILLTSMDRDGTRDGYDLELTRAVADRVPIPVIASGGVGTLEHLYQGSSRAAPTRCWPRRSSTSASSPSARRATTCARAACRSDSSS